MNKIIGPVLIIAGLVLLKIIPVKLRGSQSLEKLTKRIGDWGVWGSGLLGFIFALSFCPISAALFFGSVIPLAVKAHSSVLIPTCYGLGTALPVFGFAVVVAFGTRYLGTVFDKMTLLERWARIITGVIFIAVGIYFCLTYIFKII